MRWLGPAAALLGIGWFFAACIFFGLLGGQWLDGKTQASPLFTLLGVGVGLAVALVGGFRMLMRALSFDPPNGNTEEK